MKNSFIIYNSFNPISRKYSDHKFPSEVMEHPLRSLELENRMVIEGEKEIIIGKAYSLYYEAWLEIIKGRLEIICFQPEIQKQQQGLWAKIKKALTPKTPKIEYNGRLYQRVWRARASECPDPALIEERQIFLVDLSKSKICESAISRVMKEVPIEKRRFILQFVEFLFAPIFEVLLKF